MSSKSIVQKLPSKWTTLPNLTKLAFFSFLSLFFFFFLKGFVSASTLPIIKIPLNYQNCCLNQICCSDFGNSVSRLQQCLLHFFNKYRKSLFSISCHLLMQLAIEQSTLCAGKLFPGRLACRVKVCYDFHPAN